MEDPISHWLKSMQKHDIRYSTCEFTEKLAKIEPDFFRYSSSQIYHSYVWEIAVKYHDLFFLQIL